MDISDIVRSKDGEDFAYLKLPKDSKDNKRGAKKAARPSMFRQTKVRHVVQMSNLRTFASVCVVSCYIGSQTTSLESLDYHMIHRFTNNFA